MKRFLKIIILTFALGILLFSLMDVAMAQTGTAASNTTTTLNNVEQDLIKVLNIFLEFFQRFIWPVILMIGGLMDNDVLFGGQMRQVLLQIWSGVRDIVNIFFVLSLVGVAIANIVGISKDEYQLKAILPKLIIGIIAVNFSFFICKFVLDTVNIVSTGIFGLPVTQAVLSTPDEKTLQTTIGADLCPVLLQSSKAKGADANAKQEYNKFCKDEKNLSPEGLTFFARYNAQNAAMILAINLQRVTKLPEVNEQGIKTIKDLAINALFSAAFFIVYATAYVALFIALLIRVIVLWIIIAISPLIALGHAVPAVKKQVLEGDNDLQKMFLDHALMPISVAFVMSIGMVMVATLKGTVGSGTMSVSTVSVGALTTGLTTIQDIMVAMGSAGFIWMAVFQALAKGKAAGAVNFIKEAVEGAGKTVAKLPLYAPIVPVGAKGEKISLAGAGSALKGLPEDLIHNQQKKDRDTLEGITGITNKGKKIMDRVTEAKKKSPDEFVRALRTISPEALRELSDQEREELRKMVNEVGKKRGLDKIGMKWEDLEKGVKDKDQNVWKKFLDKNPYINEDENKEVGDATKYLADVRKGIGKYPANTQTEVKKLADELDKAIKSGDQKKISSATTALKGKVSEIALDDIKNSKAVAKFDVKENKMTNYKDLQAKYNNAKEANVPEGKIDDAFRAKLDADLKKTIPDDKKRGSIVESTLDALRADKEPQYKPQTPAGGTPTPGIPAQPGAAGQPGATQPNPPRTGGPGQQPPTPPSPAPGPQPPKPKP